MIGGVGLQIIRDWVLHFNERGPDGLLNGKSQGQPSKLNDVQRQAIARMIESGPIPAVHGVVRWRLIDLAQWIFEDFRIAIAKQTLSRELRAMGYRKLSARPRHYAQAAGAIEDFSELSKIRGVLPSAVIPGRREAASPESILTAGGYGFRAPSLRSVPGMTTRMSDKSDNA